MPTLAGPDRFRVGPPSASGMRLVTDRDRVESYWVYPTLTELQVAYGHEWGRWYFAPLGRAASVAPSSLSHASFELALAGLADVQRLKDSIGGGAV